MNGEIVIDNQGFSELRNYKYIPNNNIHFTSIIILTINKLEYTKLCIESIRKFTPKDKYEIIVVDNNSTDGTVQWLKSQNDIKVIFNKTNEGFPKGCNQGIKIAKGESILLLNNDIIVTPSWINNLDRALYSSKDIGGVGCISNYCANGQQIDVNYKSLKEMLIFSRGINTPNKLLWDYKNTLIGFCYLMKKSVIDKIGMLDERFTPGNYEDNDISFRMLSNGYKLLLCKDTFIHHFGSVSFNENSYKFIHTMNGNLQKFNDKWGFNVNYTNNIRWDLIEMMTVDTKKNMAILEIGCGTGATLIEIKNKYRNSTVHGIEICENAAKIANGICDVKSLNIEDKNLKYKHNYFDYILLGDVLEHLINPWDTLIYLRRFLKRDGYILASIPNLMHISVMIQLIKGNFTYADSGILDKTHLRFFTLNEIKKLFNNNGYEIELIDAHAFSSPEEQPYIDALVNLAGSDLSKEFISYQYLIKAKRKFDSKKYENTDMISFKYKLMRIENGIDIKRSMDYIFSVYEMDKKLFVDDLDYIVYNNIINKNKVIDEIKKECLYRKLTELYEELKVIKYE